MWTAKGTQGRRTLEGRAGDGSPLENAPCWGLKGMESGQSSPAKVNMKQTEFLSTEKTLNREECVQEGAVVNNFKGSEDFFTNHFKNYVNGFAMLSNIWNTEKSEEREGNCQDPAQTVKNPNPEIREGRAGEPHMKSRNCLFPPCCLGPCLPPGRRACWPCQTHSCWGNKDR